jgi:hypothetical protein
MRQKSIFKFDKMIQVRPSKVMMNTESVCSRGSPLKEENGLGLESLGMDRLHNKYKHISNP